MNRAKLRIRTITGNDCLAAYNLIQEIYASTDMMCQPFTEKYPDVARFELEINECKTTPGAAFLVAELPAGLVGYITIKPPAAAKLAHTAYLNMGVSEGARGNSVGRNLLSAAVSHIEADRLIEILYLTVRADNVAAVRLYESKNFETIAVLNRDTKFDGKYYDGLLMRRFVDSL
ncbi:MAG: GNAT family N-acetyltransferase [Candidatus Melainabacteria bacterium]|nr:GNAT family N-acetyltransferase [Candidatus Melainabacteria bacterium]